MSRADNQSSFAMDDSIDSQSVSQQASTIQTSLLDQSTDFVTHQTLNFR